MNLCESDSIVQKNGMRGTMVTRSHNPFTPTFGHVPFALAGREDYIDDVIGGLSNQPGDPNRSTIFVGPRGSGKTVLLTAISREAASLGWICVDTSAREGMLATIARRLEKSAVYVLGKSSASDIVGVQLGPIGVTREIKPSAQVDALERIEQAVERLCGQGSSILFTVDEVDAACKEFCDFIDLYQYFMRRDLDVGLLLAGLPSHVSVLLSDEGISFIRRAFQRPLERIPILEVEHAITSTIEQNGRTIQREAVTIASEATAGFAFAIQLVGYYLWRQGSPDVAISAHDAKIAIEQAGCEMERSVFVPTLRELRPREVEYLCAMAQDQGPSSTSEVARRMGISMTNASNLRKRLIEHGIIREVRLGLVEYEMPLLDDYLRKIVVPHGG